MKTKILGKVGIGHKGLYSNTVLYNVRDEIRYGNPASTYRCIKETLGNPPILNGDNEWWVLISQHGTQGYQGANGCIITSDSLMAIQSLKTTSTLVKGHVYAINDQTFGTLGQVTIYAMALETDRLSRTVEIKTSFHTENWVGEYNIDTNTVDIVQDNKNNTWEASYNGTLTKNF